MFYCLILLTLVAHVSGAIGGLIGTMQSAGANGTFVCNGRPEANVLVKLYDQDRCKFSWLFIIKCNFLFQVS